MILFELRRPGEVTVRVFRKAAKLAWEDLGEMWVERFRAKHFTRAAYREYGYRKRAGEDLGRQTKAFKRSYTGRKFARYRHTKPLVLTGRSEERSRLAFVQPTAQGVKVRMRVPALNFRPKGWPHPLRRELTKVSDNEVRQLARKFETAVSKHIAEIQRANRAARRKRAA